MTGRMDWPDRVNQKFHKEITFKINRERSPSIQSFRALAKYRYWSSLQNYWKHRSRWQQGSVAPDTGVSSKDWGPYFFRCSCCSTEEENIWQNTHHQEDLHHEGSIGQESAMILNDKSSKGVFLANLDAFHAFFDGLVGRNCGAAS